MAVSMTSGSGKSRDKHRGVAEEENVEGCRSIQGKHRRCTVAILWIRKIPAISMEVLKANEWHDCIPVHTKATTTAAERNFSVAHFGSQNFGDHVM